MSNDIEQRVAEFIRLHGIFAGTGGILLAVSGGADSISLLHLLQTLRIQGHLQAKLTCAHINHQLRGASSDADERFVIEQAARLGLPVITRSVDVRAYARTHRLSLETAGRQLRLASLGEIARDCGCTWIATGHQKNDNAETVLHRLHRGTGFRGLAGIRAVRQLDGDLWLARPLLCVTRDEIVRYLGDCGLTWREDHTNADPRYTRNLIRHRLLPLLQQESRTPLVEELSDLAASAGRLHDRIRQEAEKAWAFLAQAGGHEVRIEAFGLTVRPELVAIELIRRALVSLGCGERDLAEHHYRDILQLARQRRLGKAASLPGGYAARYESDSIVLTHSGPAGNSVDARCAPCTLNIPGTTAFAGCEIDATVLDRDKIDVAKISRDKDPFSEYLDWERVQPPVVIRRRLAGDRFQPLGLSAGKKVGKFLTAARVPRDVREQAMIIADREKILWLCPVRIAEPVKITERTQHVLVLTVRST